MSSDPSPVDAARIATVYQFARLQLPRLPVTEGAFGSHLRRAFDLYAAKVETPLTWLPATSRCASPGSS